MAAGRGRGLVTNTKVFGTNRRTKAMAGGRGRELVTNTKVFGTKVFGMTVSAVYAAIAQH